MFIKVYIVLLFVMTALALLLGILGFLGKGGILNSRFAKATEEEKRMMSSKPFRLQTGITFLLIAALTLVNAMKLLLGFQWLSAASLVIILILAFFCILSGKKLKQQ